MNYHMKLTNLYSDWLNRSGVYTSHFHYCTPRFIIAPLCFVIALFNAANSVFDVTLFEDQGKRAEFSRLALNQLTHDFSCNIEFILLVLLFLLLFSRAIRRGQK